MFEVCRVRPWTVFRTLQHVQVVGYEIKFVACIPYTKNMSAIPVPTSTCLKRDFRWDARFSLGLEIFAEIRNFRRKFEIFAEFLDFSRNSRFSPKFEFCCWNERIWKESIKFSAGQSFSMFWIFAAAAVEAPQRCYARPEPRGDLHRGGPQKLRKTNENQIAKSIETGKQV